MSDESLFREIDEEVRQDQLKRLWGGYGNYIVAVVVGIVLAVAGLKGWQYWQAKQAEAAAVIYADAEQLISSGKRAEAEAALQSITHTGFARFAKLRRAASLAIDGKTDNAVALYDEVVADTGADPSIRDLARIRGGYLLADKLAPADLIKRLGSLDNDQSQWRGAAREIFALSAYRTGDYSMADRYANAIVADVEAPLSLRQRAQAMIDLLTPLLGNKK